MKKKIVLMLAVFALIATTLTACVVGRPREIEAEQLELEAPIEDPVEQHFTQGNLIVISVNDLPDGFAGFSLELEQGYVIEPWASEPGWFRISFGHEYAYLMHIGQLPYVGTAQEYINDMVSIWNDGGMELSYEPPTAHFPFFAMERLIASGEGEQVQTFMRDNEKGGVFYITIQLFEHDWETERGASLLQTLASFEVLTDETAPTLDLTEGAYE